MLQELRRCFKVLFLGIFNHGVLLPTLEGHGQISELLTTPKKKEKKRGKVDSTRGKNRTNKIEDKVGIPFDTEYADITS